jgi:hypothetical protein
MSFAPHRCAIGSRPSREQQEELSSGFKKRVVYWRANPARQKELIVRLIGRNGPWFGPTDERLPSGRSFSTIPSRNRRNGADALDFAAALRARRNRASAGCPKRGNRSARGRASRASQLDCAPRVIRSAKSPRSGSLKCPVGSNVHRASSLWAPWWSTLCDGAVPCRPAASCSPRPVLFARP